MTTDTDYQWGYVAGVACERPDIALRVALTCNSEITHELNANESLAPGPTAFETTFETVIP